MGRWTSKFWRFSVGLLCGYLLAVSVIRQKSKRLHHLAKRQGYLTFDQHVGRQSSVEVVEGFMESRIRILCWVVTSPKFKSRADLVNITWGQRCDKLLFMSSEDDPTLPTVALPLNATDTKMQLWNKAKLTYQYLYRHYLDEYDWFFKADTDTYAVVENMRDLASSLDPTLPYFLGRRFRGFISGGSGYLMTAATIRLLVEKGLGKKLCDKWMPKLQGRLDDLILSVCLAKLGANLGDTRDSLGRQKFIPFSLEDAFRNAPFTYWVKHHDLYPYMKGYNCCSERAVAFHYVKDHRLQVYEYLTRVVLV